MRKHKRSTLLVGKTVQRVASLYEYPCVLEGSVLTNTNDYYDNADLTSNFTMNKRYGFEFLSGAVAGEYNITG